MQRKIGFFLALLMITVFFGGTVVFAEDTVHNHEHDELVLNEKQGSPETIEKFNNYIASLDPQKAQLILEDEELVYMMKQDAYWAPQPKVNRNAIIFAVSLPLSSYPVNSYFTNNGSACTCHSNCTPSVPTGFTASRCYISLTKSSGNCKRYTPTGAIQCKGFADYVFKQYTGSDVSNDSAVSDYPTGITNDPNGEEVVWEFFSGLSVGANVRVSVRNATYNHSFIISGKTSTGITMYDCNGSTNACQIKNTTRTWATLASKYDGVVAAWDA